MQRLLEGPLDLLPPRALGGQKRRAGYNLIQYRGPNLYDLTVLQSVAEAVPVEQIVQFSFRILEGGGLVLGYPGVHQPLRHRLLAKDLDQIQVNLNAVTWIAQRLRDLGVPHPSEMLNASPLHRGLEVVAAG